VVLDAAQANTAASIRQRTQASVADAHLCAVYRSSGAVQVTVLTSDPGNARAVAGNRRITGVTT
jgi:hypothetical protein